MATKAVNSNLLVTITWKNVVTIITKMDEGRQRKARREWEVRGNGK